MQHDGDERFGEPGAVPPSGPWGAYSGPPPTSPPTAPHSGWPDFRADEPPLWSPPYPAASYPAAFYPPPPPRRRRAPFAVALLAAAAAVFAGGIAVGDVLHSSSASTGGSWTGLPGFPGSRGSGGGGTPGLPGSGGPSSGTTATAAQSTGVVLINTVLNFGQGAAAGTGLVLRADGLVLTNNHVISGSTSISVTVATSGKQYTATVVGTDPTQDVAVVRLQNASGLTPAHLGDSGAVKVGDPVTGVGNAGGTGRLTAAAGSVTGLDQQITASDDNGGTETLDGMIEVNAPIQAGDSGGPLLAANGTVIGIDTAASATARRRAPTTAADGYAIPIATAETIAGQITDGKASATVHLGYPAFLGIEIAPTQAGGGVAINGTINGTAARQAGLVAGDTITAVAGTSTRTATDLSGVIAAHKPGDRVSLAWTDAAGGTHSTTVTLSQGPAD